MKPLFANLTGSALALLLTLSLSGTPAHAANVSGEFEYAVSLLKMQKERPAFHAEDLVERLARRLSQSPNESLRWEGRLLDALLLQSQAARATVEKRTELLGQAEAVCDEFLQKNAQHPCRAEGLKLASEIRHEFVRSLLAGEEDNSPARLAARQRAIMIVESMLPERKAAAEAAWVELEAVKLPEDPSAEYPTSVLRKLSLAIEKAVVTDQAWLNTWMLLVEACPPGERRIKEIGELTGVCQKRLDHERLMECDLACALYQYLKGRAFSFQPDEAKATEAWNAALGLLPESVMDDEVAQTVYPLQAAVLLDFVKMKTNGAEKDRSRYEEIVRVLRKVVRSATYPELLKLPAGKQLLIEFSMALERQPDSNASDVAEAFGVLKDLSAGGPPWSNNAALAMAQILTEAGSRKQPKLSAGEWYETARGCLMQGQRALREAQEETADGLPDQAETDRQEAHQHFAQALQFYRQTIAVARDPERTDLLTRVRVEPNAWFETGLCHQWMDAAAEACVAYSALLSTFGSEAREQWLPKQRNAKLREKLDPLLAALDQDGSQGSEGLLQKAMNNRKVAVRKLSRVDQRRYMDSDLLSPYERGKLKLDQAQRVEDQAAKLLADGNSNEAVKTCFTAVDAYRQAIQSFAAEDATSPARELALYHVGYTCLLAQTVLTERIGRIKGRLVDLKQAQELADLGLQAFRDYESHTSMSHNPSAEVEERRAKLQKIIRQARVHLLFNADRLKESLSASAECLKEEGVGPGDTPRDPGLGAVLFARYRALSRLSQDPATPDGTALLEQAQATVDQLKLHPVFQRYAFTDLASRFSQAAQDATRNAAPKEVVARLDGLTAEYLWRGFHAQPENERSLQDHHRLLLVLAKVKSWKRIADLAQAMLSRFDPQQEGRRIADDQWPARLKDMHDLIQYPDLQKRDACRTDHTVLVDYLYEEERNAEVDEARRPMHDRFPVDLDKAALQLETIRRTYPDVATGKPVEGSNGRSHLQMIQEEIEYRRQILNARDLLADAAIEVARELATSQPEEAARYRDLAREQLECLLAFWGNILSMKQKIVELNIANQDYNAALKLLSEIKDDAGSPDLPNYIKTSVQQSRVYRLMGDAKSARKYPEYMLAVGGPYQTYFPDIKEFLEWCYQNGAPRPKEVVVPSDIKLNYGLKTPDEMEFEESVEPAYRKGAPEDLPVSVKWRYEFLKRKIEQNRELSELDRFLQIQRDNPDADAKLVAQAEKRYEVLTKLNTDKTRLWRLGKDLDNAIIEFGSLDRVRANRPQLLKDREDLTRSIAGLEAQLAELPEVKTE